MMRSLVAVVGGYVVFALSGALLFQMSGQDPHAQAPVAFKVATVIWGAVFALVAGWLTARVAARRPLLHAGIVGGLIALGAIVSIAASSPGSTWSQFSALIVMAPCAWLGGLVARARPASS